MPFVSVPVGKDTLYPGLDFDFWANCWFFNPAQASDLLSKVVLETAGLGKGQIFLQLRNPD